MNAVVKPVTAPDRRAFIGGSDIASILGISPWLTPVGLYERKTAPPSEEKSGKAVKRRGHRWESVVAEMLVETLQEQGHTVEIVASNKRYIDQQYDFMACEIDFEIRLDGESDITNVELKTVHPYKTKEWGEEGTDQSPVWYTAQAMYGLGVTNRQRCIIAPLFGADEIKAYPIERDDETINLLRSHAYNFWHNHVLPRIPPEPISIDDLRVLFPHDVDGPALIADDELIEKVIRLRAIDRELDARAAEWDVLEFQIKQAMKHCTELVVREKSAITWKERAHSHLDQEALKERFPKIHKELMVKSSSRVFSVKKFAWDR